MEIEKNIPLPKFGRSTYPFTSMDVGDSVLIAEPEKWAKASNAAFMVGARDGKKFTTKRGDDGLRIWRVA